MVSWAYYSSTIHDFFYYLAPTSATHAHTGSWSLVGSVRKMQYIYVFTGDWFLSKLLQRDALKSGPDKAVTTCSSMCLKRNYLLFIYFSWQGSSSSACRNFLLWVLLIVVVFQYREETKKKKSERIKWMDKKERWHKSWFHLYSA